MKEDFEIEREIFGAGHQKAGIGRSLNHPRRGADEIKGEKDF